MLRDCIQTKDQLNSLVSALSQNLTLGTCADLIDRYVTDDEIKANLDRVVGKKADATLKDRKARELAAKLLDFENAHAMAAHYNSQKSPNQLTLCAISHSHRHGHDVCSFLTARSCNDIGFLSIVGPLGIDFEPNRYDEDLTSAELVAGDIVESQVPGNINIDKHVGYCVLDDEDALSSKLIGGDEFDIHQVMGKLEDFRDEIDSRGFWGEDFPFEQIRFDSSIRPLDLNDSTALSLILEKEGSGEFNTDYQIDSDAGIYVEYSAEAKKIYRVIFFAV